MEKFQLQENETLVGSGMMAYKHRESITRQPTRGTIYVTNQRVCYYESWSNYVYMNLPLSEVAGYASRRALFVTFVHIYDKNHTVYSFSGFPAKKLQEWLRQVGVKDLSQAR
jgi:hypothetical protein